MQKITTFLWFDGQAEAATDFYLSVFKSGKLKSLMGPKGQAMGTVFEIEGQEFMTLNGGPEHKFTPAISLFVKCRDQAEVDYYWGKLLQDGGREDQCGWLQDKYGLSWQVIPSILGELLGHPDRAKAGRAMQAMLAMKKIVVADLEKAASGG